MKCPEYDIIEHLPHLPYVEYADTGNGGHGACYREWLDGSRELHVPGEGEVDFSFRNPDSEALSPAGRRAIGALASSMWQL